MSKAPTKVSDKHVDLTAQHSTVACEVCMTEVPASLAKTFDGLDYVHYFCGLDCLEKWRAKHGGVVEGGGAPAGKP